MFALSLKRYILTSTELMIVKWNIFQPVIVAIYPCVLASCSLSCRKGEAMHCGGVHQEEEQSWCCLLDDIIHKVWRGRNIRSLKRTAKVLKNGRALREKSSSNHWFSGAMLVSGSVMCIYNTYIYIHILHYISSVRYNMPTFTLDMHIILCPTDCSTGAICGRIQFSYVGGVVKL